MGGDVRKVQIVECDEDTSFVRARSSRVGNDEDWSVTVRPYRPRPAPDELRDQGDGCTCLLAGNRVAMADGGLRAIERVAAGDRVLTMSGAAAVRRLEVTRLGMTRKVIEIRGVGDECLMLSDDHPLWVSRKAGQGTTREWWGTYNLNHVLFEMRNMTGYDLSEPPTALNFDLPERIAHVSGWLHVRPIFHHLPPGTHLYHLVVDDACSYVAEGFPVFSHCGFAEAPSEPWRGVTVAVEANRFVAELLGAV